MTQKEMFLDIWGERMKISEVSGNTLLPIGHYQWHWQFAHVLGKGAYPKFKFYKDNIMLMLPIEHQNQEKFRLFQLKKQKLLTLYYNSTKCHVCSDIIPGEEIICGPCYEKTGFNP